MTWVVEFLKGLQRVSIITRAIKHCLDQGLINYERLKTISLEVSQTTYA